MLSAWKKRTDEGSGSAQAVLWSRTDGGGWCAVVWKRRCIGRTAPGRRSQVTLGHACGSELLSIWHLSNFSLGFIFINLFRLWQCNELILFELIDRMAKKASTASKAAKKAKAAQKVEKKETKKVLKAKGAAPNNAKGKSKAKSRKANDSDTDDDDLEGILRRYSDQI